MARVLTDSPFGVVARFTGKFSFAIGLLIDRINQQHFDAQPLNLRATAPTRIRFGARKDPLPDQSSITNPRLTKLPRSARG
jgi:hypothetical protein